MSDNEAPTGHAPDSLANWAELIEKNMSTGPKPKGALMAKCSECGESYKLGELHVCQSPVRAPETAEQFITRRLQEVWPLKDRLDLLHTDTNSVAALMLESWNQAAERVAALTRLVKEKNKLILSENLVASNEIALREKAEADLAEARELVTVLASACYYTEGTCFFCGAPKGTTHLQSCLVERFRAALQGVSREEKK